MNKSFDERRKHLRTYRNFILRYHEKGKPVVGHDVSQVNNVSKGGISFSSTHALKVDVIVMIDLKTPFIADSIHMEGVVVECKEKIPELIYEIRLKFQNLSVQQIAVLEKIEKYSKDMEG